MAGKPCCRCRVCIAEGANALHRDADGCLSVCISTEADNQLVEDAAGCLYVPPSPGVEPCISTDAGNQLTEGTDGCLYVPPPGAPVAPVFGQQELTTIAWSLTPLPQTQWHDAPLTIALPAAGTYRLGGAVTGEVSIANVGNQPSGGLHSRLFDTGAGAEVPWSMREVAGLNVLTGVSSDVPGDVWVARGSAPVDVLYTVPGPTTIVLQGLIAGASLAAGTYFSGFWNIDARNRHTVVNFHKIA